MGFISFVGRVLFASLFLLSAYQEYDLPPSSLAPQIPSHLSMLCSFSNRARLLGGLLLQFCVGCLLPDLVLESRVSLD